MRDELGHRRSSAALALAGAAVVFGGCVAAPTWDAGAEPVARAERQALVFNTEVVEAAGLEPAFDRFEFSRNDGAANVVARGPMNAARAWPLPPRPAERRVRFSDWQQR